MPVRYQLMVSMLVPLLLAVAISLAVFQTMRTADVTDTRADRSAQVLLLSQELMVSILNAQTGTRGFVITGEEQFLRPYAVALEDFAATQRQLRQHWSELPDRLALLDQLVGDFERYQREITEVAIEMRRFAGVAGAPNPGQEDLPKEVRELFLGGDDKALVDRMKLAIDQMIGQERRSLDQQLNHNLKQRRFLLFVGAGGPLLAVLLVLLLGGRQAARVTRGLEALADAARRIEAGNLDSRIALEDSRETAAVSSGFNRMAESLQQRGRQAVLLDRLGKKLQSCHGIEEAFEVASAYIPRILRDTAGAICLYRASRDLVETHTAWGGQGEDGRLSGSFEPNHCWALRTGYTYRFDPDGLDMPCRHLTDDGGNESLCIPMSSDEEILGILVVQAGAAGSLSDEQRAMAAHLAETLAICVTNLRLRETLRNQSIRDPLTDLFNRRYLDEALKGEFARVQRTGTPLSMIVLDADHFKRFNDTWGHDAGDAVLVSLARLLRQAGRESDLPCRLGGEEFALVLPECDTDQAMMIAEKIRAGVEALAIQLHGKQLEKVTVSLGVAGCPEHASDSVALIKAADLALYRAKAQGRNRVERAG